MKTLLVNLPKCQREECCCGKIKYNVLPAQIFLSAKYLMNKGKDVTIIDLQTQKLPDTKNFDIVVIWVSILDGFYEDIEFIKKIKTKKNKTIMILNDPMGCEFDVMSDYPFIDICVRLNEREIVLEKVITAIESFGDFDFEGVIFRSKNKLVDKGTYLFCKDLTHLESSADLLKKLDLSKYEQANIITGRGCPMGCTFCQYSRTGSRKRKIEDIMDEFEAVNNQVREVYFLDLNMPANMPWFKEFLHELIKRKNKHKWKTDIRLEACNPEILRLMRKAGCSSVLIGIESVDKVVMQKILKYKSLDNFDYAKKLLDENKLEADFTFMIGFPWDSEQTLQNLYDFIIKKKISSFGVSMVMPVKGTQLYEDYKRLNLIKDLSYKNYVYSRSDKPISNTIHIKKERIIYWYNKINDIRLTPRYWLIYMKNNGFKMRYIETVLSLISERWKRKSQKNT